MSEWLASVGYGGELGRWADRLTTRIAELEAQLKQTAGQRDSWKESNARRTEQVDALEAQLAEAKGGMAGCGRKQSIGHGEIIVCGWGRWLCNKCKEERGGGELK
jgi:hypothetical protein